MLTYEQTRPWAMAMKLDVQSGKMPPWFADPRYGKFSNAMSLSPPEIETLTKWADAGAPKGDPKDMPPPVDWVEGWGIGKPDLVYELPMPFDVPASGVIDYQHVIVPTGFTEDKWIQAAEVRPLLARSFITSLPTFANHAPIGFAGKSRVSFSPRLRSKRKSNRIPALFPAISSSATRRVSLPKFFARARPSSSKPARTLFFKSTTRPTAMPLAISQDSASSLQRSRRKNVCLLCPLPTALSKSHPVIPTIAWMPVLKSERT